MFKKNMAIAEDTEPQDSRLVDRAVELIQSAETEEAQSILMGVISRTPEDYSSKIESDGKLYIKFWDRNHFLNYAAWHETNGRREEVIWLPNAYPRAYFYLAYIYFENGQYETATKILDEGLLLEPHNPKLINEKAQAMVGLGRYQNALPLYEDVLALRGFINPPDKALSLRGKGLVLIEEGQLEPAEECFRESLHYEADNKLAKDELRYIEVLRSSAEESKRFEITEENFITLYQSYSWVLSSSGQESDWNKDIDNLGREIGALTDKDIEKARTDFHQAVLNRVRVKVVMKRNLKAEILRRSKPTFNSKENLLVVDDDEATLNFVGKILENLGYEVVLALESNEAVDIYEKHRKCIKAVITDLNMPEMNGIEIIEWFHKQDPSLPIVLTSRNEADLNEFSQSPLAQSPIIAAIKTPSPFKVEEISGCLQKVLNAGFKVDGDHVNVELPADKRPQLNDRRRDPVQSKLASTKRFNKQELKLVLSDYDDNLTANVISEIVKCNYSDEYDLKFKFSFYGDELLEFAETGQVDVFVLNLNCITNYDETLPIASDRLEYSLQILNEIKKKCRIPVIAYSGFSEKGPIAKLAGADFYLDQPFKVDEFLPVFEKSLMILPQSVQLQNSDKVT